MTDREERVLALREAGPKLSVGLFAGDLGHLQQERDELEGAGVSMLHLDIADGRYSPFYLGFPGLIGATSGTAQVDVHLLVEEPLDVLDAVVEGGADMVTFHPDAARHPHRVLQALTAAEGPNGAPLRGIALTPSRPVSDVLPFLPLIDIVLAVAINPGWGGQPTDPRTAARLREIRATTELADHPILVGADGGIGPDNAATLVEAGADYLVSGTAVFAGDTPERLAAFPPAIRP